MDKFKIARADGRSNAQVLLDLFSKGEAGQLYPFQMLADVLSEGVDKTYSIADVRAVCMRLYKPLLKQQSRAIHNVRKVGYRLAQAHDHSRLAIDRRKKADGQFLKGLMTLQNVRWDEMEPEARKAHEGQLMIVSAIHQQSAGLERRLKAVENAIAGLKAE